MPLRLPAEIWKQILGEASHVLCIFEDMDKMTRWPPREHFRNCATRILFNDGPKLANTVGHKFDISTGRQWQKGKIEILRIAIPPMLHVREFGVQHHHA